MICFNVLLSKNLIDLKLLMKCYIYLDFLEPICNVPLTLHQVFRVFVCKVGQDLVGIFDIVVSFSSKNQDLYL